MSLAVHGFGASPGVAIGAARFMQEAAPDIPRYSISIDDVRAQIRRLDNAVHAAHKDLQKLREKIPADTSREVTEFIDTHLLMLADHVMVREPKRLIKEHLCNAEWAVRKNQETLEKIFDSMQDAYLRTRKDDIKHVIDRILHALTERPDEQEQLGKPLKGHIVFANDLAPYDAVRLHRQGVCAIALENGGLTSHAVILAKSLRLPMVIGLRHAMDYVKENETVILDGAAGSVLADPDEKSLRHYKRLIRERKRYLVSLEDLRDQPTRTGDGEDIRLMANAELPQDFSAIRRISTDGVGLYRTEFLYMNREDPPDEEEHYQTYLKAIRRLRGATLSIRTLDSTHDSDTDIHPFGEPGQESSLGLRAIRFSLRERDLFQAQLRAILRVSAKGPVRLLLPLLTDIQEVRRTLEILDSLRKEMDANKQAYDPHMPIGGMIEVPAAAICADIFAQRLDFMTIGTNDLIQYTMAADRGNEDISHLYEPLHPAILRMIRNIIKAGEKAGIPVGMCGEFANEPRFVRLLLALGLREFSVPPANLLEIRHIINETRMADLDGLRQKLLRAKDTQALHRIAAQLNADMPA